MPNEHFVKKVETYCLKRLPVFVSDFKMSRIVETTENVALYLDNYLFYVWAQ